jgi:hypothetical protein
LSISILHFVARILNNKWVDGGIIFFFYVLQQLVLGTDNAEELDTCGFQHPVLSISILHFIARIGNNKWVNGGIIFFFWCAATAYDVLGTSNAGELDKCGFQYPVLSISILHFLERNFGCKQYSFALLYAGESGKHQYWQAIFTCVNITFNFSKVRAGLPGVCLSKAMI